MADHPTILVAVDLAADWNNTIDHAAFLCAPAGAHLHLLYVVRPPAWLVRQVMSSSGVEPNTDHQVQVALARLQARAEQNALPTTFEVRVGKPAEVIVEVARSKGVTAIVLGNNSHSGSMFVGTVGDRVLRHGGVPVLVVGHKPYNDYETVLVPTALGSKGVLAMKVATSLGTTENLLVVHVLGLPSIMRSYSGDVVALRRQLVEAGTTALAEHVAEVGTPNVRIEPILRTTDGGANAAQGILDVATERDADLIVLSLGSSRSPFFLGRTAEKLTRAMPCSMLALPPGWAPDADNPVGDDAS